MRQVLFIVYESAYISYIFETCGPFVTRVMPFNVSFTTRKDISSYEHVPAGHSRCCFSPAVVSAVNEIFTRSFSEIEKKTLSLWLARAILKLLWSRWHLRPRAKNVFNGSKIVMNEITANQHINLRKIQ